MEINDTIQSLANVRHSIDGWVAQTTTRPDALIADLNDLYIASVKNGDFEELFEYSDVGSPSLTLHVAIDAEFDLERVMAGVRTRLRILRPASGDDIGNAGVVWSHGRYDFVYDDNAGVLGITHKYSHKRIDTKSVSSIAKQMIDYAVGYLEEIAITAKEGAAPKDGDTRLPREGKT
ncbi:MAG: hypothetical protein ABFE01_14665 [Phycisphaerales bacterium]|jgi:hypothetical protein